MLVVAVDYLRRCRRGVAVSATGIVQPLSLFHRPLVRPSVNVARRILRNDLRRRAHPINPGRPVPPKCQLPEPRDVNAGRSGVDSGEKRSGRASVLDAQVARFELLPFGGIEQREESAVQINDGLVVVGGDGLRCPHACVGDVVDQVVLSLDSAALDGPRSAQVPNPVIRAHPPGFIGRSGFDLLDRSITEAPPGKNFHGCQPYRANPTRPGPGTVSASPHQHWMWKTPNVRDRRDFGWSGARKRVFSVSSGLRVLDGCGEH